MKAFFHSVPDFFRESWAGVKTINHLNLSSLRKVFSLMGKKEKILFFALVAFGAAGLLWSIKNYYYAATSPTPGFGGSYSEGFVGQPSYINPVLAFSENDLSLVRLVYSGLYKYDGQGNLTPDLAESLPQISEDQKQYTVRIKQNAKWHNGRPVKADDILFTIAAIKDPAFKSPLRAAWASTNVEKIDDSTVKFTTKEIFGPFINTLTLPILPQNLWGKTPAQNFALSELNFKAVGSGPFTVNEIKKLASGKIQAITFASFSNYYAGKPKLDEIVIKFYDSPADLLNALHSGEIQGFGFVPFDESIFLDKNRQSVDVRKFPLPQFQTLFFNLNNKNLADARLRSALNAIIDRENLVKDAFKGEALPAASLFHFYNEANSNNSLPTPAVGADTLMEAAGWKRDTENKWVKNGQGLEFNLYTSDFLPNARVAESLAQTFRNFGVNISLNILPAKQLSDNQVKPRNFDLLVLGQKLGADPDPFSFWHSSQVKDPGNNLSGFSDLEADQLIIAARTSTDQELRKQKYLELDELMQDRLPVVFLNQTVYNYALDNNLKGVNLTKLYDAPNRFYDAANWYIMEDRVFK